MRRFGKLLRYLLFGRGGPVPERKEMTRGQQTFWIVGAIAVATLLGLNYMRSHDDGDRFSACKSIFAKAGCEARIISGYARE